MQHTVFAEAVLSGLMNYLHHHQNTTQFMAALDTVKAEEFLIQTQKFHRTMKGARLLWKSDLPVGCQLLCPINESKMKLHAFLLV